jgi:cardiolipin synthase
MSTALNLTKHQIEDDWRYTLTAREAWAAMLDDCAHATQRIEMEQYILQNDEAGASFIRLFIDKARQGVQVSILCDEVGSAVLVHSPLVKELRNAGGVIEFYNSLKWIDLLKPRRVFPRTHLKVLAVDGKIAYVGSVCMDNRMRDWRDTHIRVTGPVVQQVCAALAHNRNTAKRLRISFRRAPLPEETTAESFSFLQNEPSFFRHPIYQLILRHIYAAERRVLIASAYFVPTRRLRRFLCNATDRGVEVIVLVPARSDARVADWACISYAASLLKSGVRLFLYQPTMMHTKAVMIDGVWATCGSCNLDPLSFFHNREANLILRDTAAIAQMESDFQADLAKSRELTMDYIRTMPWWERAVCHLARVMRPVL